MSNQNEATAKVEAKKTYLQQLRDRFYAEAGKVRKKIDGYRKTKEVQRRERKEFNAYALDFLKDRGVPKKFKNVNARDMKWNDDKVMMKAFQDIVKRLRKEDRGIVVHRLNEISSGKAGEDEMYLQGQLGYYIFREVTGRPYMQPRLASQMTIDDVQKRNFFELIGRGIWVYKRSPLIDRIKFNKAVTPRVKKEKVVAPQISQQQAR